MEQMSNEIIVHTLKDIQSDVKEIKAQTTKTNGRVSTLENWQAYIKGALAVIGILLLPIIFIIISGYLKTR